MEVFISNDILLRAVVPFGAANVFFIVLMYFFLVRHRIGRAYPYYTVFIFCFIIFLLGPLINLSTPDISKRWYDLFRNILLFSFGIPCLMIGLLYQAKLYFAQRYFYLPFILGISWSVLFCLSPPLYLYDVSEIPWLINLSWLKPQYIYLAQIFLVFILLALPCGFILRRKPSFYVAMHVYGTLALCAFMTVGNLWQQWSIYYAGSSFTALIWGYAVFADIRQTQQQIKQQKEHQKRLAKAQFLASDTSAFTHFYPDKFDEEYPFKEREALLDCVRAMSIGMTKTQTKIFFKALERFAQGDLHLYQVRVKEIVFMAFDFIICRGGETQAILGELALCGREIDNSLSIDAVNDVVSRQLTLLCSFPCNISPENNAPPKLVNDVKAFILTNYHRNITVNDIIENIGSSRSHAMKTFKTFTDQTMNQYLIDVRINKAKQLLLSKKILSKHMLSRQITEVAFDVGFSNSAYFSTVFKKQVGITPTEYQQRAKQSD